ncbi:HxlR family transcriptional regulator, partial [Pseudomonas sp. ABAC21]
MKRKCLEGNGCPVARALDVVGDWWTLLIIRDAFAGVTRFGDFQKHLGVAKNILATRLKDMVEQGLLETRDVGARSDYQLTDKGRALMPVLVTLAQWGE